MPTLEIILSNPAVNRINERWPERSVADYVAELVEQHDPFAKGPVTQDWTHGLTLMQQSVLISAVRGPDGIKKDHIAKLLVRWLRRCTLRLAFGGDVIPDPYDQRGGSFTGPSLPDYTAERGLAYDWRPEMDELVADYLRHVDEIPHHYQLHFMHAAEIIGYKHPRAPIAEWWLHTYHRLVNDAHLMPEPEEVMDKRLGDREADWRAAEEVTAAGPGA